MKILSKNIENTGGGCMVMFVDVSGCYDLIQIGIDDECMVGHRHKYGTDDHDDHEKTTLWAITSYKELMDLFKDEDTVQLLMACYNEYCSRMSIRIPDRWLQHPLTDGVVYKQLSAIEDMLVAANENYDQRFSSEPLTMIVKMNDEECPLFLNSIELNDITQQWILEMKRAAQQQGW